jgi:ppGpp synthetase/RelA/SpoT-type nucleotidyltranferase
MNFKKPRMLRDEFIDPEIQIYGRTKEIDSLLKKLILKPDKTYEDLTDKAGIRVIVKFTEEVDKPSLTNRR